MKSKYAPSPFAKSFVRFWRSLEGLRTCQWIKIIYTNCTRSTFHVHFSNLLKTNFLFQVPIEIECKTKSAIQIGAFTHQKTRIKNTGLLIGLKQNVLNSYSSELYRPPKFLRQRDRRIVSYRQKKVHFSSCFLAQKGPKQKHSVKSMFLKICTESHYVHRNKLRKSLQETASQNFEHILFWNW